MKKVLFVIGTMANGGAERVISVLANRLNKKGYSVSIVTIIDNRVEYQLDDDIMHYSIELNGGRIQRNIERIRKLKKIIREVNPDAIISFLAIVNMTTLIANVGIGKQVIVSERNDPAKEPAHKISRVFRNLCYRFLGCDGFVFQTQDAMNYFGKKIKGKSVIIPNPITNLPEVYTGERRKNIVTIARLEPQKNIPLLLSSFAEIHKKYPEYVLEIYGRGYLQESLQEYAKELKIESSVIFHGFAKNVHESIVDAGMYVMSSNYEGISNGMLEALGMGLPVIATDCPIGGARMFINDGVNGLLIPTNNKEKMVSAILSLIEDECTAEKLGKKASAIREELNVEKITGMWRKLIESEKINYENNSEI